MSEGNCAKIHEATVAGLTFSSDFDSGNASCIDYSAESNSYNIWIASDCEGTQYENQFKTWFHFSVKGFTTDQKVTFCIRSGDDRTNELKWSYCYKYPVGCVVYFAMCYPLGYGEMQLYLAELESVCSKPTKVNQQLPSLSGISLLPTDTHQLHLGQDALLSRELLARSICGRRIDIITVFSSAKGEHPAKCEQSATADLTKPVVLLTARVHPGETPGQFALLGALNFALSDDPRAVALRHNYDIKFIPMINPDGVYMGNYRTNSQGVNLNRQVNLSQPAHQIIVTDVILNPGQSTKQWVGAVVSLAKGYAEKGLLKLYADMHGHANKTGCFLFGNALKTPFHSAWNRAFARLMNINSPYFDLDKYVNEEYILEIGDTKEEGEVDSGIDRSKTKEGCGRVAIYKITGLTHSYTLECNYARPGNTKSIPPPTDPTGMTSLLNNGCLSNKTALAGGFEPHHWAQ
ncbi:hypothetical protein FOL47_010021, partial [Perkinsus chesapeaki]